MKQKPCKDCLAEGRHPDMRQRPIVENSGGRCATHHRENKKRQKGSAHEKRVQDVYGLRPGEYDQIYRAQGGRCAICQRATGASRKLAVDHDHKTGLARGLLCSTDNKLLGHFRDDPAMLQRAISYLIEPPARKLGIVAVHKEKREDG